MLAHLYNTFLLQCSGGYPEVTTNRTTFPLSNGFFTIKTGHPDFTGQSTRSGPKHYLLS
jgi:hypothetical protein